MKRLLHLNTSIFAMAIINPPMCKNSSIQIELEQRDEGNIPHVHVYLDKTRDPENCAWVRLDKPEYLPKHKSVKLKDRKKEEFICIMEAIWPKEFVQSRTNPKDLRVATGYVSAVNIWEDTFGESKLISYNDDGFPAMPNYKNL